MSIAKKILMNVISQSKGIWCFVDGIRSYGMKLSTTKEILMNVISHLVEIRCLVDGHYSGDYTNRSMKNKGGIYVL